MQKEYKGRSAASLADGADVRVMSYNVLVDNDEANGGISVKVTSVLPAKEPTEPVVSVY